MCPLIRKSHPKLLLPLLLEVQVDSYFCKNNIVRFDILFGREGEKA